MIGGIIGGILLLKTGEQAFRFLVPYLILFATALMAIQAPLRNWLVRRSQGQGSGKWGEAGVVASVFLASIYGGFFGAGLSVIVIAVLALALEGPYPAERPETSSRLLRQHRRGRLFLFSGKIVWWAMLVMAVGALVGGNLGGAGRDIWPALLRGIVVTVGLVIAVIYFIY